MLYSSFVKCFTCCFIVRYIVITSLSNIILQGNYIISLR
nr:MAG TPA: hypothetical protein [Caudoviricetes sp.]